jgi:hypothetical protein
LYSDPGGTEAKPFAQPGSVDYEVGTRTDPELIRHLKGMTAEQRGEFLGAATGKFQERVRANLQYANLGTKIAIPEITIEGKAAPVASYPSRSADFKWEAPPPEEPSALEIVDTLLSTNPQTSLAYGFVKSIGEDIATVFEGDKEKTFPGASGRPVTVTVSPDPAEKIGAYARLGMLFAPSDPSKFERILVGGTSKAALTEGLTARAAGEIPFDPAKLEKIQANLEKEGAKFTYDASKLPPKVGARYVPRPEGGGPGELIFKPNPSRSEVIEELLHLGQNRRDGFPRNWLDSPAKTNQVEMRAQVRLHNLKGVGWTAEELDSFRKAWEYWRTR